MTERGIHWSSIPGDRINVYGRCGRQVFKTHIGHGRVWYAFEYDANHKIIDCEQFGGPENARRAREWCEVRLQKPRKRTHASKR